MVLLPCEPVILHTSPLLSPLPRGAGIKAPVCSMHCVCGARAELALALHSAAFNFVCSSPGDAPPLLAVCLHAQGGGSSKGTPGRRLFGDVARAADQGPGLGRLFGDVGRAMDPGLLGDLLAPDSEEEPQGGGAAAAVQRRALHQDPPRPSCPAPGGPRQGRRARPLGCTCPGRAVRAARPRPLGHPWLPLGRQGCRAG
jgi:hypothetical protein